MSETLTLARYVRASQFHDIPDDVRHEAARAFVNYLAVALCGSIDPAVGIAIRAFDPFSGGRTAAIIGRPERFDPLHAALFNGISAHVDDFDDTTPQNYIHPTSPVASALFAYASVTPVNGRDFLHALVLGFEAESRIGNAVYPAHYDAGWHITGTAGVFGAATAIGRLIGLSEPQMVWAIGLAATQASGLREMFGSMAKSYHVGHAAKNGFESALLAQAGFTAGRRGIEGPRGFAAVQSARFDLAKVTADLGHDFNLRRNAYKPYPCGIVNHPTIDASIMLHDAHRLAPGSVRAVRVRVAPLVLDLCNQTGITVGLQGKFSVYHNAAIGLVRGQAGPDEYTDAAVNDPEITRVRELVTATGDASLTEDQAYVEVDLADGRTVSQRIEQSLGNIHRPLTDGDLDRKFLAQAKRVLPESQANRALERCWAIEQLADVRPLIDDLVPAAQPVGHTGAVLQNS